ncbi:MULTISPECIES: hypothetical protein [Mycobacteriaceae]|uniref:hypothetical protein n=1 Tax=Mycobacteroides abscessus TaxID=36809 RepID=UPI000C265899|nr:hypothetical protein [Mycobacteroides abscessus]
MTTNPLADLDAALNEAADTLLSLIVRTRFRNPGTSADPYTDALILWLSTVTEAREAVAPLDVPPAALRDIETLYRRAVEVWLRDDEPTSPISEVPNIAAALSDADLHGELRRVLVEL